MASALPLSSLRLLIAPLRLLTAAMWRVARQHSVRHYGLLEGFVATVTEAVPDLLTDRQKRLLLLALRAKMTLSDHEEDYTDMNGKALVSESSVLDEKDEFQSALGTLSDKEKVSSADRQRLLQEVFDHSFDSALLDLLSDFLSRLEQMFPVPDFKQAASWLDAAPAGVDECLQEADCEDLKDLLTNHSCLQGRVTTTVGLDTENVLLAAWSHPLFTKLTNPQPLLSPPADNTVVPELDHVAEDLDLVKVEVVVSTEDEQEQRVGQNVSCDQQEAPDHSSVVGNRDAGASTTMQMEELKNPTENSADQSEDGTTKPTVDQSSSEAAANPLFNISHISQRVAHRCPQCNRCFIYRSQVIRHLRTNKSCGKALTAAGVVNPRDPPGRREKSIFPPEPRLPEPRPPTPRASRSLSCFQCNSVFRTKAELLSHQRSHRTRAVYQCSQCGKKFHQLSSLTNHKQTHLHGGGARGSSFNQEFEAVKERDVQSRQNRQQQQERPQDLMCTVCKQEFSSQNQLLRHLQTHSVEGAAPQYSCRFCELSFSGVTQLRIHQRSHADRSYQCDLCSKMYGSLTGLQSHRLSHSSESRFLCPQCGKRFKTRDGLEGHLRTHTGERPYCCPYCPKNFTALAGLNVHVRRHTGERPYVCTVCGKGWPSGGDLQKHMRTHTGERPYVCVDCGKAFSISCHLTEHRRIHTGEKPFSCPECGKCLRRKFDLKKHLLSHSNVRPYACVHCPKSYTRKTHLTRHQQTHSSTDAH